MQQYEKEHLELVLKTAAECTVLLKKDGHFPLKNVGQLAAFGAGLRYTVKGGTGSGEVNSRFSRTIEEGLENAGFEITTKKWLDDYDAMRVLAKKAYKKALKEEAKAVGANPMMYGMGKIMPEPEHDIKLQGQGDTAIYVVARNSGEGADRQVIPGDVKLSESEIRDILAANQQYENFMLVLNVGGVVDLSPVAEVGNILLLSQLGVDNGQILADIMTGKQVPSGKLTTTWAAWEEYCQEGDFGSWDETHYKEGIYVGYRYFDTFEKKVLFPFGFGLGYTDFEVKSEGISVSGSQLTVKSTVKNTGSFNGKEVVQVYLSQPSGKLDKAYQDLAAYAKTKELMPAEQDTMEIKFDLRDMATYDEETESYILEKGDYIVRLGVSSKDTEIVASVTLDQTVTTLKAKNCLGSAGFADVKSPVKAMEIPEGVLRISIPANAFTEQKVEYQVEEEIDSRVKDFSDEELATINIGAFNPKGGALSVIGNAASHVAGAAGETTSLLEKKGYGVLVMADGPAGLRLSREYFEDSEGAHDASGKGMIPESMLEDMPAIAKLGMKLLTGGKKKPKDAVIKEHYATMIPIGTAIAQSFNYDLARSYGDMVGSEMEMMGVQLWLAPALNIHRSILCGRNFEYYSEDPLVSGMTAAAITEGVQAHKNCGVTIKHYAANNAETNRFGNNSNASERAMREIYLRGFGICVKKSDPRAVMTSYNLLNGKHTAEHSGLIQDILRREYGFSGIVMTDWIIAAMKDKKSVHRTTLSNEVAKAGGDLHMPGCKGDFDNIMKDLKSGELTRNQLEINASRVIRMVERLNS